MLCEGIMKTTETLYHLILKPLKSDIPTALRLRRLLKYALRVTELRCVKAFEEPPTTPPQPAQGATEGTEATRAAEATRQA